MLINNLALWGTFLSGLGALAALIISLTQYKRNTKYNEANFWLTLRENFNKPDRVEVHKGLRMGNWILIYPTDCETLVKIEDYMGLFEVCERMLEKKIIDEQMFRGLYEYRIYNFLTNKELALNKLVYEYYDWTYFYKLLARLYGKKWDDFHTFLQNINLEYNEINSESDFLHKLSVKQIAEYKKYKNKLALE